MSTRTPDSTHEAEPSRPASVAPVESPSAEGMQGANGLPHVEDPDSNAPTSDQDIDTAGTDADDESPTKAMGSGVPPAKERG